MADAKRPLGLSRRKVIAFTALAMLLPLAAVGALEIALRLSGYGDRESLFVPAPYDSARYLIANPRVAARYFRGDPSPPTPPVDGFLRDKPSNGYRIVVLGESTTAGFPYPANGTFSRILADALRDVLPSESIEVVNIGIPATTTYALYDQLPDVIAIEPDAVLIYAGHNEYYGALGSASTLRLPGGPAAVRVMLRLRRLRTVMLIDRGIDATRKRFVGPAVEAGGVSRMEELASLDTLRFGGPGYAKGAAQLKDNLDTILSMLRRAGVRTYVASLTSNLRDQAPFASDTGTISTNAAAAFAAAHVALTAGDTSARSLFTGARDLDLVRFRAPTIFNEIIRRSAAAHAASYVPVDESFAANSRDRIPGSEQFFEHVHPRPAATALIARAFYDRLAADGFGGRRADTSRLGSWVGYTTRMTLTPVDERIAQLIVDALMNRWPFVTRASGSNFLASYRPASATDSNALRVVLGQSTWVEAKLAEAARREARADYAGAVDEYSGLMRDQPWNESPFRFAARAWLSANQPALAKPLLERAHALSPTPFSSLSLARIAATDSSTLPLAASLLQQALRLGGFNPDAMYQLSLVLARQGDLAGARTTAGRLYQAVPNYPGLVDWMKLLKM